MAVRPLTVAWISFFPVEWLPNAPEEVRRLPRQHPATWQRVLLGELEKNPGLRLHVIALRKTFPKDFTFERNGVTFHLIKTPGGLRAPSLFWVDTILVRRVLARIRPDLIHAWGTENGAAMVAARLKYPHLVTVQGLISWYQQVVPVTLHDRVAARIERYSLARAPLVTTESNFSVNYVRRHFPRATVRQIEHAPDWVFHRVERKPQTDPIRFLFVGGLDYRKGADLLVRALDQVKNEFAFELLIVGKAGEALLNSLKAATSPELWKRVRFKADLNPPQVAEELATATMVLYPTRADVSPNSVKEAVVAGVPVVASAVGGITDYVFPEESGLLFPAGDLAGFVEAILVARQHPLFSQGRVKAAALARAREYLSPALMGRRFLEAYEAVSAEATMVQTRMQ